MKRFICILLFVCLVYKVDAIGISSDFLENNTLELIDGSSTAYGIRLQNPDEEEVNVRLVLDSNIAEIIDYKEIYILPRGKTEVLFNITAPKYAKIGDIYTIGYYMEPVSGFSGGIPIGMKINKNFRVKIVNDPNKFYFKAWHFLVIVGVVFLLIIFYKKMSKRNVFKSSKFYLKKRVKKMRKSILILFLVFLIVLIKIASSSNFNVGLSITGFDSDGDGIADDEDSDDDNDGLSDDMDYLTGNSSFIITSTITPNVTIDGDINLTKEFTDSKIVEIKEGGEYIVNFTFSFGNSSRLNLANITIEKQSDNRTGSLLIKGINLRNSTKTVYVNHLNTSMNGVCVKDAEISSISDITIDCNGTNESLIRCPGSTGGYACSVVNDRYKVTGLTYSGVIEKRVISEEVASAPSTGGGGGTTEFGGEVVIKKVVENVSDFAIDKESIKVVLKQGGTENVLVTVSNTGDTKLLATIDLLNIGEFVTFPSGVSEYSFEIEPKKEKTIQLLFNVPLTKEPDIYSGKIVIRGNSIKKVINTIIEVESEKPLFDVGVEVLPIYKKVFPGYDVSAKIILYNLGMISRVDVSVSLGIKDSEGNIIISKESVAAVETQITIVETIRIPSYIAEGNYIFYAKVTYNGVMGTGSDIFEVIEKPSLGVPYIIFTPLNIFLGIIIIVLIFFMTFITKALLNIVHYYKGLVTKEVLKETFKKKKLTKRVIKPLLKIVKHLIKKPKPKITAEELLKEIEREERRKRIEAKPRKEKLEEQLKLLEESFRSGLVSKEAYNKDKNKIEKMLREFK